MARLALGSMSSAFLPPLIRSSRARDASEPHGAEGGISLHVVAAADGRFMGWPANHGLWRWDEGRELLVGHGDGPWTLREGHNVGHPQWNRLARSLDGGRTWRREVPEPFVGSDADRDPVPVPEPIPFLHPDLALRVVGGNRGDGPDRVGRFFVSTDRGHSWRGPYLFPGLASEPQLLGLVVTSRTDYVVTGDRSALIMMSAMDRRLGRHASRLDKAFVAETLDGGNSFRFVSWVVPWADLHRAVMPSTVALPSGTLLSALRRRNPRWREEDNWVDLYGADRGGRNWTLRSRVGETGAHNGNPPALTLMRDGRLACAYGNRSSRRVLLRLSEDEGRSWGPERIIRDNPHEYDLGYPQLTQNHRGELVLLYYLATRERPQSYIEAALFRA